MRLWPFPTAERRTSSGALVSLRTTSILKITQPSEPLSEQYDPVLVGPPHQAPALSDGFPEQHFVLRFASIDHAGPWPRLSKLAASTKGSARSNTVGVLLTRTNIVR